MHAVAPRTAKPFVQRDGRSPSAECCLRMSPAALNVALYRTYRIAGSRRIRQRPGPCVVVSGDRPIRAGPLVADEIQGTRHPANTGIPEHPLQRNNETVPGARFERATARSSAECSPGLSYPGTAQLSRLGIKMCPSDLVWQHQTLRFLEDRIMVQARLHTTVSISRPGCCSGD